MKQNKIRQGGNSHRGRRAIRGLLVSVLALGLTAGLSGFGDVAAETAGEQVRRVEVELAARAAAPVAWSTGAAHEGTSASAEEFTHRMRAPSSQ